MSEQTKTRGNLNPAGAVDLSDERLDAASASAGAGTVLFRLAEDNMVGAATGETRIVNWDKSQELKSKG